MKINLSKFLRKLVAANGINFLIDQKAVGIGALLFSEEVGGYIDPDYIDGYTYNPQDGGWYKTPPAPAYGDNAWGEGLLLKKRLFLTDCVRHTLEVMKSKNALHRKNIP